MIETAFRLVDRLARWAIWAAGMMILAAAVLISVEVGLKGALGISLRGAEEFSGYLFAIGTSWSLPFVLIDRGNVRIDTLYMRLSLRARIALDILSLLVFGAFMLVLAKTCWTLLVTSAQLDARSTTPLQTPQIYPQALWFAGIALFLVALALLLARCVQALVRGAPADVGRIAGAPSMDEEIDRELQAINQMTGGPVSGPAGKT
ncbi:MAG: TRAP transporter small permease [Alphaproteobacteria bacterium]|nr:TRAP transporter small permease [Alphaproteobacteria bacterium]